MIKPDEVLTLFRSCLFQEGEDTTNYIKAEGITITVGFHPERIKAARPIVAGWLLQLPDDFQSSIGGGTTFLNMCVTKDQDLWGQHIDMERLCQLAIGSELGQWTAPREMWMMFHAGMPYFTVKDEACREALRALHPEHIIVWSEEDQCFVGSAPPVIGECCHGDTEGEVEVQLLVIIDSILNPQPKPE